MNLSFKKIDLATSQLDKMVDFYSEAFGLEFEKHVHGNWTHYQTKIGEIEFFLAPNEPAGTTENQSGVHQFHLIIENLGQCVSHLKQKGYLVEEVHFGGNGPQYCVRDPDNHPWILSK